jgi:hypothetical protein
MGFFVILKYDILFQVRTEFLNVIQTSVNLHMNYVTETDDI